MRAMYSHSQAVMADNNNNGPLLLEKGELEEGWAVRCLMLARLESTLFGRHMSYMTKAGIKTW